MLVFGSRTVSAAQIPFLALSSGAQPAFHLSTTDFSFGSADQVNPVFPGDPVYGMSAPLVLQQLLPVGPIEFGYLHMDPVSLFGVIPPTLPTDPVGFVYGPGTFSIAMLDLVTPSLVPYVQASFTGLAVFVNTDATGTIIFPSSITFSGLSFGLSQLYNPGTAVLQLDPYFDAAGAFTGDFVLTSGTLSASTPEPGTWLLLATGLPMLAEARRRLSRSKR